MIEADGLAVSEPEQETLRDLLARFGGDGLSRRYARAVGAHWTEWWTCREELRLARQRRREGKGRRPSQTIIQRLQRRDRAAWELFDRALCRLEALAKRNGHRSVDELLAQAWTPDPSRPDDGD